MDIQKRIDRFIKNKLTHSGGSVKTGLAFSKLIKIAEAQDRQIIISINSPGGSTGTMKA